MRPVVIARGPLTLVDATQHGRDLEHTVLAGIRRVLDKRGVKGRDTVREVLREDRPASLSVIGRALTMLANHEPTLFYRHVFIPLSAWMQVLLPSEQRCAIRTWEDGEKAQRASDATEQAFIVDSLDGEIDDATLDAAIAAKERELFAVKESRSALIRLRHERRVARGGAA